MPDNMPPAYCTTNRSIRAHISFIQDLHGNLVDIHYHCFWCADQLHIGGEWWPAFDFGESDVHCHNCHILLNNGVPERMYA